MEVIKTVKPKVPANIKRWRVMYDKGICLFFKASIWTDKSDGEL